jgi:hypothetical protein
MKKCKFRRRPGVRNAAFSGGFRSVMKDIYIKIFVVSVVKAW